MSLQPVDLKDVVNTALRLTASRWKEDCAARNISISIETDLRPVPAVQADSRQICEALVSMIMNAADAMPNGGVLRFATRAEGPFVTLDIADTGIGMPEEILRRCMEPLYTTKGNKGTGMGLAIARRILENHNGRLEINSIPGQGTTVRCIFPLRKSGAPAATPPEDMSPDRQLKILLVDDDIRSRDTLKQILERQGHSVSTADHGAQGFELFAGSSFDAVISDRAMPDMSGDVLAEKIKRKNPEMPVLMLTGFGDLMQIVSEKPEHVDIVVGKPVSVRELNDALARLVKPAAKTAADVS